MFPSLLCGLLGPKSALQITIVIIIIIIIISFCDVIIHYCVDYSDLKALYKLLVLLLLLLLVVVVVVLSLLLSLFQHEKASVDMFEHLMEKNKLGQEFDKYLTDTDLVFIAEQIAGPQKPKNGVRHMLVVEICTLYLIHPFSTFVTSQPFSLIHILLIMLSRSWDGCYSILSQSILMIVKNKKSRETPSPFLYRVMGCVCS